MKSHSLRLLTAAIACAAAVSIGFVSCDNNSSSPTTPGNNGGKTPEALAGSLITYDQVSNSALGNISASVGDRGLNISGFQALGQSGLQSAFTGINTYNVDFTLNANTGGAVEFAAAEGLNKQAALTVTNSTTGNLQLAPFFSAQDASDPASYDVEVYNNGTLVASELNVPLTKYVITTQNDVCCKYLTSLSWRVSQIGQCVLQTLWDKCCIVTVVLPLSGRAVLGNDVKFIERKKSGNYPYVATTRFNITGNSAVASLSNVRITAYSAPRL